MNTVWFIRSPEADFRPEKYISDEIIKELRRYVTVEEIESVKFDKLNSQSLFYDDDTMTRSFTEGLSDVCSRMRDSDYVFFADAWNPALPVMKFHSHCAFKRIKMGGIFHSSAETPGDFLDGLPWATDLERYLLKHCLDQVFVATEYSRSIIHESTGNGHKVIATGLPAVFPPTDIDNTKNNIRVVFAHRWAPDKDPERYIQLANLWNQLSDVPEIEFVVLHPLPLSGAEYDNATQEGNIKFIHCDTKAKYWEEMAKASITFSSATLETFGYAIIDGLTQGAVPLVPNTACYPHLYQNQWIYDGTVDDALNKLVEIVNIIKRGQNTEWDSLFMKHNVFLPGVRTAIDHAATSIAHAVVNAMAST